MRVLHLVKTSDGAGWAYREMRELVSLGIEVHVAMPLGGYWTDSYRAAGIVIHEMEYSLKKLSRSCGCLRSIVSEVDPDIIQSHFVVSTVIMRIALRRDKRPRVFKVPGPLHLENWFTRRFELALAQQNDYWVGSCSWTCLRYQKSGIRPDRVFMCFYGGDRVNQTHDLKKNVIRHELSLPEDAFIVGMVAYMYPPKKLLGQKRGLKGHEDFIDAIALVAEQYPNVYGVCVGGAWGNAIKYEEKVKAYGTRKTNHVFFLGTRDDVPDLYNDMQLAVHPSHSENLGGAGESLLFRVPTIATNVGGFPDLVKDKITGILIPPKSPSVLAQTIIDCIEGKHDLNSYVENGYAYITKVSDVKTTALEMVSIYNKILGIK